MKLVVPNDGSIEFRQTFTEHHFTIYADPAAVFAYAERESVRIRVRSETEAMNSPIILFDLRSGNVIAAYAGENDAWTALRHMAEEDGLEEIEDLALSRMQDGHPTLIAMEDELVRRVAREMSQETIPSEARR